VNRAPGSVELTHRLHHCQKRCIDM